MTPADKAIHSDSMMAHMNPQSSRSQSRDRIHSMSPLQAGSSELERVPHGTYSNGDFNDRDLQFQSRDHDDVSGALTPGRPVRPVIIHIDRAD